MADATKKTADNAPKALAERPSIARISFASSPKCVVKTSKVTWPTWKETYLTTIVVFIMVGVTMVFFFGVDWLLAYWRASG